VQALKAAVPARMGKPIKNDPQAMPHTAHNKFKVVTPSVGTGVCRLSFIETRSKQTTEMLASDAGVSPRIGKPNEEGSSLSEYCTSSSIDTR